MLAKSTGISGIIPEHYFKAWQGDKICFDLFHSVTETLEVIGHLQTVNIFIWILVLTVSRREIKPVIQLEYTLAFNS